MWTLHTRKQFLIYFSCIAVLLLSATRLQAQISIVTPYPAVAGDLTRGGIDTSELQVKLAFGSTVCNNVVVTVNLADGVYYVPGSVSKVSSNISGSSIAVSNSNTTAPSFAISGMNASGDFTFIIKRTALCGAGGSFKDGISVTSSCGTVSETNLNINKYDVKVPSIALVVPSLGSAIVGNTYTRTLTITNGGNGALDTVDFYMVLPSSLVQLRDKPTNTLVVSIPSISTATFNFTPVRTNGDSLFYRFAGPLFGTDLKLTNGEAINIQESDSVISCGQAVIRYGASWGKNNSLCQIRSTSTNITASARAAAITYAHGISPALSGCIEPFYTLTDTFIVGSTSTPITYRRFYIFGITNGTNVILDTNSIAYSVNGGASFTQVAYSASNVANTNTSSAAPCLTGRARSYTVPLASPIVLQPGTRLIVRYNVITSCRNTTNCPVSTSFSAYRVEHTYSLPCTSDSITVNSRNVSTGYAMSLSKPLIQKPAQVDLNQSFSLVVPVVISSMPAANVPAAQKRRGSVSFTLPTGIDFISVDELQDTGAIRVVRNGQNVTAYFKPNASSKSHLLKFTLKNTGACSRLSIPVNTEITLDTSCAAGNANFATLCDTSISIRFRCSTGNCAGISGTGRFSRLSFGIPDNNTDGIPDSTGSLNFQKVDTTRLMIGDTLRSISLGIVNGLSATSTTFNNGYGEWNFSSGTWLPAGNATVTLVRSGSRYVCGSVPIATVVNGNTFRVQLNNATGCSPALTFSNLQNGDSVYLNANFRLSGSQTGNATATLSSSVTGYTFQNVIESQVTHRLFAMDSTLSPTSAANTSNTTGNGYLCDTFISNTYIAGWERKLTANNVAPNGCSNATQTITGTTTVPYGQFFIAEYRPIAIPDSFKVTLPSGWNYDGVATNNGQLNYVVRQGTRDTVNFNVTPLVRTNTAGNTELVFSLLALRQSGTIPFEGAEGVVYSASYNVRPASCSTTNGTATAQEYGRIRNPFNLTLTDYQLATTRTLTYGSANRSNLVLENVTGDITASAVNNSWDLDITAKSQAASNIWLATEMANGSVQIDSVGLLNTSGVRTGALLTANNYGAGNKWYNVTASLSTNAKQRLRVYFRYNNCEKDSIKVYSGYDCNGNTNGPTIASCTTNLSQVIYPTVTSRNGEVQISVSRQPGNGNSVSLCAQDSATFIVNSAAGADIVNPRVQISIPTGMQLVSPIPVEFPSQSGKWQALTPTAVSGTTNTVEINLSQHTGILDTGIRGTVSRPDALSRQAKVKVAFTTDCNYRSGNNIVATAYANQICGGPVSGNGSISRTNPVEITGIPNSGGTINMDLAIPTATLNCGSSTTLALTSTPLGNGTQAGDTIVYVLPAGVSYGGNFTPGTNCTGCTVITAPGTAPGTTDVAVSLPAGLPANTAIQYSFDITGSGGTSAGSCGNTEITAMAVRTYPGVLSCDGVTYCSNSTRIIGTTNSGTITRVKPNLNPVQLIPLTLTTPGSTVLYRVQYQNNGTQDAPAATYKAEFIASSTPNAPIHVAILQKAVLINASAADTISFVIPANTPPSDVLSVRIAPDLKDNTTQCLCSEQTRTNTVPLPLDLLSFTARLKNQSSVELDWSLAQVDNAASFVVERSTNGADFVPVETVKAMANTLEYRTADRNLPEVGRLHYRLKLYENSGAFQYSPVQTVSRSIHSETDLTILPNPTKEQVTLRWNTQETGVANIYLINSQGKTVLHKQVQLSKSGAQEVTLSETASLASGVYLIRIITPAGEEVIGRLQVL